MKSDKLESPKVIEEKMNDLYRKNIEDNKKQVEIYCELMLALYNKKDRLSETEIKFVDLLKRLIEKGVILSEEVLKQMVAQNFTKEEVNNKDFKELLINCQNFF